MATTQTLLIKKTPKIVGINPTNLVGIHIECTVAKNPDTGLVIHAEERPMASGKGSFQQFTLHLIDNLGQLRKLDYLFEKDLSPLADAYEEDPQQWEGKTFVLTANMVKKQKGTFAQVEISV